MFNFLDTLDQQQFKIRFRFLHKIINRFSVTIKNFNINRTHSLMQPKLTSNSTSNLFMLSVAEFSFSSSICLYKYIQIGAREKKINKISPKIRSSSSKCDKTAIGSIRILPEFEGQRNRQTLLHSLLLYFNVTTCDGYIP